MKETKKKVKLFTLLSNYFVFVLYFIFSDSLFLFIYKNLEQLNANRIFLY